MSYCLGAPGSSAPHRFPQAGQRKSKMRGRRFSMIATGLRHSKTRPVDFGGLLLSDDTLKSQSC